MSEIKKEQLLHMPDLFFVKFCEEEYGVNRGIYNTIDRWFFKQGIKQIVERRNAILAFLHFHKRDNSKREKIKFGPKGLTEKLKMFLSETYGTSN